jgi:hypothetical protein
LERALNLASLIRHATPEFNAWQSPAEKDLSPPSQLSVPIAQRPTTESAALRSAGDWQSDKLKDDERSE